MKRRTFTTPNTNPAVYRLVVGLALSLLFACTEKGSLEVTQGNGGGSEAVALVGSIEDSNHVPVLNASVRLRPKLFLSDTSSPAHGMLPSLSGRIVNVQTDKAGGFRMDSLLRGEYTVEVLDSANHGSTFPLTIKGDVGVVNLQPITIHPTGSVTGSIVPPAGFAGRTWVQIYGLDHVTKADSATGQFRVENIPPGTYILRLLYSAPVVDAREVDSVITKSDTTVDIGAIRLASFENENYFTWPQSQRFYFNTTASGANVPGNVDDFPVLIRLNKTNFDFSKSNGNDIRFSDQKGKRLRYEIERWDAADSLADIWVRVDRINGNSNTQFISMHWGITDAESFSDGRIVFGADIGFSGVWHLKETYPDTLSANTYEDALGYDNATDGVLATDRSGVIGYGTTLGIGDYLSAPVANPLLQPNERVTVGLWFKAKSTGALGGTLLSMGDSYSLNLSPNGSARFTIYNGAFKSVETPVGTNLLDASWHHLAGTYDGAALNLYLDGKFISKAASQGSLDYRFWPSFMIGRHGNRKPGYDFSGSLDQLEVSGEIARSADWIKLTYENQRVGSKLLEVKP